MEDDYELKPALKHHTATQKDAQMVGQDRESQRAQVESRAFGLAELTAPRRHAPALDQHPGLAQTCTSGMKRALWTSKTPPNLRLKQHSGTTDGEGSTGKGYRHTGEGTYSSGH